MTPRRASNTKHQIFKNKRNQSTQARVGIFFGAGAERAHETSSTWLVKSRLSGRVSTRAQNLN